MRILFLMIIFLMVLIAFLANPAPQSIEPADVILLGLPCVIAIFCLSIAPSFTVFPSQYNLLVVLILYLSYLLLSTLIGLLHGVPLLMVLRSIGPYLDFFPLVVMGFLPKSFFKTSSFAFIVLSVGLLQIAYLSYLYFYYAHTSTVTSVLVNRITFLDPRTTLPFLLAVPLLPICFFTRGKTNLIVISLIFIGLLAGIITLTRAIFLSILVGWIMMAALFCYKQIYFKEFSFTALFKKFIVIAPLFLLALLILSTIPKIHLLELGLQARFSHTANGTQLDYTNGRLYDEWIPALTAWMHSGWLSWAFGIGAGNSFTLPTGETRTYIHNLSIYTIVYGGVFGLFACVAFYFVLFKTLIMRALQSRNSSYLVFASLLTSLFFYGQLFAVHKVLAFNLLLFLLVAMALREEGVAKNVWY